uniref:Uncharacterized protein n=1 Tax=Anguilla anguilla TaxID=7936 RepID=A0A0E9T4D4_ANGAN
MDTYRKSFVNQLIPINFESNTFRLCDAIKV